MVAGYARAKSACRARRDGSPRVVLLIVCAGVVLASLDLFIVNVALPQMAKDFHVRGDGLADLSWVLNGYAIVYASLLVLFGRLAERYPASAAFCSGSPCSSRRRRRAARPQACRHWWRSESSRRQARRS